MRLLKKIQIENIVLCIVALCNTMLLINDFSVNHVVDAVVTNTINLVFLYGSLFGFKEETAEKVRIVTIITIVAYFIYVILR